MRLLVNFLLLLCCLLPATLAAQSPALAEGNWLKLAIPVDGVYKLDASFLKEHGLLPSDAQPEFYRLYGFGGGMLPQANVATRPEGLPELALHFVGKDADNFDKDDFLLFYAQGPDHLSYNPENGYFTYEKNIYSDTAYYFLTYTPQQAGKRIQEPVARPDISRIIDTYPAVALIDGDELNLIDSGRRWLGEQLGYVRERSYELTLPRIADNSTITIQSSFVSALHQPGQLDILLNGQVIGALQMAAIQANATYADKGVVHTDTLEHTGSGLANTETVNLQVRLQQNSQGGNVYLDQLLLSARCALAYPGKAFQFRPEQPLSEALFRISSAPASLQVWEVSNPQEPIALALKMDDAAAQATYLVSEGNHNPEFIAFQPGDAKLPAAARPVTNQHIRSDLSPELLIISHPSLKSEAERLARHRSSSSGLVSKVVTTSEVYNEFSSGRQDVSALRDYARYLYQQGNGKLRYLLLFGRGSFDYRNKGGKDRSLVPVYESRNSTHPIYSYASDDYFGFLDEEEGEWAENEAGNEQLDIGIGRIPAQTVVEARAVVDKIIAYETSPDALGPWRNTLTLVADDGDYNIHQQDAERLGSLAHSLTPSFQLNKIYFDAFEQEQLATGESAPRVSEAIKKAFEDGSLIINYTGHGNRDFWAGERVLTKTDIASLKNRTRLPLLLTATCEFGQHDGPVRSAAEELLIKPAGGAIALLTTARPVFSNTNFSLNQAFYQATLSDKAGKTLRLGDIMRETKNNSLTRSGVINRNFVLLGDPSMQLALPTRKVQLNQLQDLQSGLAIDSLKAYQTARLQAQVVLPDGSVDSKFSGHVRIELYDKPDTFETLGKNPPGDKMSYQAQSNVLYRAEAKVVEGKFEAELIVPSSLRYDYGPAKFQFYTVDPVRQLDAAGSSQEYIVGGSLTVNRDQSPPRINLFLNDSSFQQDDQVEPDALLLAYLQDEQGIEMSSTSLGHELSAWLDDSIHVNLAPYYEAMEGSYKTGRIRFPLRQLKTGEHRLRLRASDTHQNAGHAEIHFRVGPTGLKILSLNNVPNPFRGQTQIHLLHNRPEDILRAELNVYRATGQLVYSQEYDWPATGSTKQEFLLDCTNLDGKYLTKGLYLFKINLRSESDGSMSQASSRFIILD